MRRIVPIDSVQQIGLLADGRVPALPAEKFGSHAPDLHLAAMEHGVLVARLSLWWTHGPELEGEKVGAIGHYEAADESAGLELLSAAEQSFRSREFRRIVAPINGSPWRHHRFIVESAGRPAFFLEPQHPQAYPLHFQRAGFSPAVMWKSVETEIPPLAPGRTGPPGLVVRPIDLSQFDLELDGVHALLLREQKHLTLQGTMSRQAFIAKHRRDKAVTVPDLTLLAEHEGKLVGAIFAVPDLLQRERQAEVDTLVIRQRLLGSSRAAASIGKALLTELFQRARKRGFTRVIHALIPDTEAAVPGAEVIRRYALLTKPL